MNYKEHFVANITTGISGIFTGVRRIVRGLFHIAHGIYPSKRTSHEHWGF